MTEWPVIPRHKDSDIALITVSALMLIAGAIGCQASAPVSAPGDSQEPSSFGGFTGEKLSDERNRKIYESRAEQEMSEIQRFMEHRRRGAKFSEFYEFNRKVRLFREELDAPGEPGAHEDARKRFNEWIGQWNTGNTRSF